MNKALKQINKNLAEYLSPKERKDILKTFAELHSKTKDNQRINQNLNIAKQASLMKLDSDTIVTCLLLNLNKKGIEKKFNSNVLDLLEEINDITKIEEKIIKPSKKINSSENKRNLLISMTKDYRVLVIKIIETLKTIETHHLEPSRNIR